MSSNLALLVTPFNPTTLDTPGIDTYLGMFDLGGQLTISGSGVDVSTALLINALGGNITVTDGATFDVSGLQLGFASNINIGPGGELIEGGTDLNVLSPINFTSDSGKLDLQNVAGFNQVFGSPITGFQIGDTIQVNTTINGASYNSATDTLTLTENGVTVGSLNVTGPDLAGATFTIGADPSGGYDIGVACFLPDARVLTDHGEVPVGEIAIGDRVVTLSGEAKPVKWIGRRSYSASMVASAPYVAPVVIRAGALADGLPKRDLHLSPCHAMYIDQVLIEAGNLVNGVSIARAEVVDTVEYVNLEFDTHEVIFVEGAPAETGAGRGNRMVYDNAAEYAQLYPDEAQGGIIPYCAPRLDCGFVVEAVRRRTDERAGIAAAVANGPGPLNGWISSLDGHVVRGIAYDEESTVPVVLEVLVDGVVVGEAIANHDRKLLIEGKHIEGRCGFNVALPEGLSPYRRHVVSVRRKSDQAELVGSPYLMEAATPLSETGRQKLGAALAQAAASAGSVAEVDRVLAFLAAKAETLVQAKADLAGRRADRAAVRPVPGRSELTLAEQRRAA